MDNEQIMSRIRLNLAFERMVVAVFEGAVICTMVALVLHSVTTVIAGTIGISHLVSIIMRSVYFGFLVFLAGFFSAAGLGLPLFSFLERMKTKKLWPYLLLAIIVQFLVASAMAGHFLTVDDFADPRTFLIWLPGPVIAFLFWREIQGLWRATDRMQAPDASEVVRLH